MVERIRVNRLAVLLMGIMCLAALSARPDEKRIDKDWATGVGAARCAGAGEKQLYGMGAVTIKKGTHNENAAAIGAQLKKKFSFLDDKSPGFKASVAYIVKRLGETESGDLAVSKTSVERMCLGFNEYRYVEEAVLRSRMPAEFRAFVLEWYANIIITRRTVRQLDLVAIRQACLSVPDDAKLVTPAKGETVPAALAGAGVKYAGLSSEQKVRALHWIAAFNPHFRCAGYYISRDAQPKETQDHVPVALDGAGTQVILYERLTPEPILLPGASGLKGLLAADPPYFRDCGLPEVTTAEVPRRIVLRFDPGKKPQIWNHLVMTLYAPEADGPIISGYARTPLLCNLLQPVHLKGLELRDGKLTGQAKVNLKFWGGTAYESYHCTINAGITEGNVDGTFDAAGRVGPDKKDLSISGKVNGALLSSAQAGKRYESTDEIQENYSRWRGEDGSGAAAADGTPLVDSMHAARFAWRSEEKTPGAYFDMRTKEHFFGVQGGYAGPVIADGRVYAYYYYPNLDVFSDEHVKEQLASKGARAGCSEPYYYDIEKMAEETYRRKCAISADDVVLCLDGATGRTLWKATFKSKGANYGYNGRGMRISAKTGPLAVPSVVDGRVYALGSTGRVYCNDAVTGKCLWESTVGVRADYMDHLKQYSRRSKSCFPSSYDFCSCPAVVGDVVVLCDHTEYKKGQRHERSGLVALARDTGKVVWTRPRCCGSWLHTSPLRWVHKGKEYIITTADQVLYCLSPADGGVIWKVDGLDYGNSAALNEDYILCNDRNKRACCYRITPKGATLQWRLGGGSASPYSPGFGNATPVIVGEYACFYDKEGMACVELKTGKLLARTKATGVSSSPIAMGDRVISEAGARGNLGIRMLRVGGKKGMVAMGTVPRFHVANSVTLAAGDGRVVFRGMEYVYCYDLRHDDERLRKECAELLRLLQCGDQQIERLARRGLAERGVRAGPPVVAMLNGAVEAGSHTRAGAALGVIQGMPDTVRTQAGPAIARAIRSGDALMFDAVTSGLADAPKPVQAKASAALLDLLDVGTMKLWPRATALLVAQKQERVAIERLTGHVREGSSKYVPPVLETVLPIALASKDTVARQKVVKVLTGLLESKDQELREMAAEHLGAFGADAKSAVPALIKAKGDLTPVRAAAAALEKIPHDTTPGTQPDPGEEDLGLDD